MTKTATIRWMAWIAWLCAGGMIAWSFAFGGKEAIGLIPLGVLGVIAGFLLWRVDAGKTNYAAIAGALFGLLAGGAVGATCGLGRLAIAILNPSLAFQDYEAMFGGTFGGAAGAAIGALLAAAVQRGFQAILGKQTDDRQSTEA